MHGMRTRIAALILALALLSVPASDAAVSLRSQRSKLNRIQQLMRQQRNKLSHIKQQERRARTDLNRTQGALAQTRYELDRVSDRLATVKMELAAVQVRLQEARIRTEQHHHDLEDRLVRMYKYGRVSCMEVFLSAGNFSSFVNRLNFLRLVARQDLNILNDFIRQKEALAATEREVAAKQQEINHLKQQVSQKERVYRAQAWAQGAALQDIRAQRARYEQELAQLEISSNQVERMIRRLMNTPQGRRRSAVAWHGSFALPVNGRITSEFGYRTHPIFKTRRMHTGIDIAVPMGTPVCASAAGEVIYTGNWGGYGLVVIIDHGGGLSTLYAHNSRIASHAGKKVSQGQVIAYAGSTGFSTGPHVHFEVRRNGVPVNPRGGW
ncbi:MAG: peptidoglycan DD-metalloendopeptidase family protein [bacterium]|nr:peptidoglycan DD-metalloendopeptidase family protein [bacterium]MDD4153751.1 peptidoglycan DD-metalloendopeptidase family protein [bacterium]